MRRSKRRTVLDYVLRLVGIRAWRCGICGTRFHGRVVPVKLLSYAHCPRCGNFALQRVPARRVDGAFRRLRERLGASAYRCDPCRYSFFTRRPLAHLTPRVHEPRRPATAQRQRQKSNGGEQAPPSSQPPAG